MLNTDDQVVEEIVRKQSAGKRGFAAMSAEERREIASKGGKAAHEKGTGHEFSSEEARLGGHKGGAARQTR